MNRSQQSVKGKPKDCKERYKKVKEHPAQVGVNRTHPRARSQHAICTETPVYLTTLARRGSSFGLTTHKMKGGGQEDLQSGSRHAMDLLTWTRPLQWKLALATCNFQSVYILIFLLWSLNVDK